MSTVIYPGSFDPFTNGHLDLVLRAGNLFDHVLIGIGVNPAKKPMFTPEERKDLIEQAMRYKFQRCSDQFKVVIIEGLLVDALEDLGVDAILRGVRAFSDFEYEMQMAELNRDIHPDLGYDTIFMPPQLDLSFVSSSTVKELAMHGAYIDRYVPYPVADAVRAKIAELKRED